MEKSGEQPPPQRQQDPKRGAEEMSLDEAPMPPVFGNANQSEGDVFKVCLPVCTEVASSPTHKTFPELKPRSSLVQVVPRGSKLLAFRPLTNQQDGIRPVVSRVWTGARAHGVALERRNL